MKRDLDDSERRVVNLRHKINSQSRNRRRPQSSTSRHHDVVGSAPDPTAFVIDDDSLLHPVLGAVYDPIADAWYNPNMVTGRSPDAQDSLFERTMMGAL